MPPYPEKQSPLLVRLKQKKTIVEAEPTTTPDQSATHTEETSKVSMNVPSQIQEQDNGLLVSLDTTESNGYTDTSFPSSSSLPTQSLSTKKLLFKNSDIIFENDLLQIGVKVEEKKNVLAIEFYYGNKTNSSLSNISTSINLPGELESGE